MTRNQGVHARGAKTAKGGPSGGLTERQGCTAVGLDPAKQHCWQLTEGGRRPVRNLEASEAFWRPPMKPLAESPASHRALPASHAKLQSRNTSSAEPHETKAGLLASDGTPGRSYLLHAAEPLEEPTGGGRRRPQTGIMGVPNREPLSRQGPLRGSSPGVASWTECRAAPVKIHLKPHTRNPTARQNRAMGQRGHCQSRVNVQPTGTERPPSYGLPEEQPRMS